MNTEQDSAAFEQIVRGLEQAWNKAEGAAFAAPFADDADFVNVYGGHTRGKQIISEMHDLILRGVYARSILSYQVKSARMLSGDVALVHVNARLNVPAGVMAGEHRAQPSIVFVRDQDAWKIAAFHNTFIKEPPPLN